MDTLLPENWRDLDLYERRNFLNGGDFGSSLAGTVSRERVCTMEIWCECFGREAGNIKKADAYELNGIMAKIEGWQRYDGSKRGNIRFPLYGSQNGNIRTIVKS